MDEIMRELQQLLRNSSHPNLLLAMVSAVAAWFIIQLLPRRISAVRPPSSVASHQQLPGLCARRWQLNQVFARATTIGKTLSGGSELVACLDVPRAQGELAHLCVVICQDIGRPGHDTLPDTSRLWSNLPLFLIKHLPAS